VRWLLDEMLPPAMALKLNEKGHDAVTVVRSGLVSSIDRDVFAYAVETDRVIVTENYADFAAIMEHRQSRDQPCVPVVFVRRTALPRRGAMAEYVARKLHRWSSENPEPYIGLHWV
jgi:predicted nuclease of predicted toxin-antitoxin system